MTFEQALQGHRTTRHRQQPLQCAHGIDRLNSLAAPATHSQTKRLPSASTALQAAVSMHLQWGVPTAAGGPPPERLEEAPQRCRRLHLVPCPSGAVSRAAVAQPASQAVGGRGAHQQAACGQHEIDFPAPDRADLEQTYRSLPARQCETLVPPAGSKLMEPPGMLPCTTG